jgi:hypothetical protein
MNFLDFAANTLHLGKKSTSEILHVHREVTDSSEDFILEHQVYLLPSRLDGSLVQTQWPRKQSAKLRVFIFVDVTTVPEGHDNLPFWLVVSSEDLDLLSIIARPMITLL